MSETNQSLAVTANETDTSAVTETFSGNQITGVSSTTETSTEDTNRWETITNSAGGGPAGVTVTGSKQHHLVGTTSETGNEITGAYTLTNLGTTDTFTNSEIDTNQTLTVTHVETGVNSSSGSETGNNVLGTMAGTSYENSTTTVTENDNNQSLALASTLVTVAVSTIVSSANDITGVSSETTTATSNSTQIESEINQTQTISFTETATGSSTATNTGNSFSGSFSLLETSSETSTTTQTNTNQGQAVGGTTIGTASTTLHQSGNNITGDYTLSETVATTGTQDQSGNVGQAFQPDGTGGRSFSLHDSSSGTTTRTETGNELSGSSTSTLTGTSSDTLTKSDTYSSTDYDQQTVTSSGTNSETRTENSFTGSFSANGSGNTTTVTTHETGQRHGQSYSMTATDTTTIISQITTGNSITGDQTATETITESSSQTVGVPSSGGSGYTLTQTGSTSTTQATTSNLITGSYTVTGTESSFTSIHEVSRPLSAAGTLDYSLTADQTDTLTVLTRTESGNEITGTFSRSTSETDSLSLGESGSNADGAFSASETSSSAPTLTETGNSVTGDYSITEIATTGYTFDQSISPLPSTGEGQGEGGGSGTGSSYSLHETGSNVFTVHQTGSTVTGDYSQTTTSSDSYTLTETGTVVSTGGNFDYSQTITATDTATQTEAGNDLTGQFQLQVTGTTSGTQIIAGTDHGTPFSWPSTVSTSFAVTESGNYVDGSLSLSETGSDRYHLLEQFSNTSNVSGVASTSGAAAIGPGNVDYSPVGAPLSIGQGPAAPTGGGAYPGEQSPAAEQQDPFAQQGLDLLHEYCFAAGTLVLTKTGAKPIEQIEAGELVLSVDDKNPDGPAEWKPVEQVYHNDPAELLNVHIRADQALPLPAGESLGEGSPDDRASTDDIPAEAGTTNVLRPTFNHPFYVIGKGWTPAAKLEPGDRLRTPEGRDATVTDLFPNGDVEAVFNLRVGGNHTYFVAGSSGQFVLVHNASKTAPDLEAVMERLENVNPAVAEYLQSTNVQLQVRDASMWDFMKKTYNVERVKEGDGCPHDVVKLSASLSDFEALKLVESLVEDSSHFKKWAQKNGYTFPTEPSASMSAAPGTIERYRADHQAAMQAWDDTAKYMKDRGATDGEVLAYKATYWGNAVIGPGGIAETGLHAIGGPIAAKGMVQNGGSQVQVYARRVKKGGGASDDGSTPTNVPSSKVKVAMPEWLKRRFKEGQEFDKANRGRYQHNEVEAMVEGEKFRVDSYNPREEIVSRRFTQLSKVDEKSAIGYLNEITRKYAAGSEITDSPFNPKELRGKRLKGDLIFEVPVQDKPVPKAIRDAASERSITIRDVNGKVYNP